MAARILILKSHVNAYTRSDGVFVNAHEDSRVPMHEGKIATQRFDGPEHEAQSHDAVQNPLYHRDADPHGGQPPSRIEFERKGITHVDHRSIISPQKSLNPRKVNRIASEFDDSEADPVHLIRMADGRHVLAGGNHRTVASIMSGRKTVKAHVIDHSEIQKSFAPFGVRLLLKSAPGAGAKIAHQAGYAFYGNPGRWHKITAAKPAPKGAPVAHHPEAAGQHVPAAHFTDEQWAALKLPDTNVNAPAYNKALDKLKEWSDSGNVTAIVGAGYGTNTYGQKLAKIANHLLALYGSQHKVTSGQKAGTHAATQAPAQDAAPQDAAGPYAKLADQLKAVLSSDMHAKVDAFVAALNSGADEQEAFDAADFGMQAVAAQKVLASKHGMHVVAKAPAQFQPVAKHPKLHSSGISSFMVMDGHNVKIANVDESEGGGYALFIDDKYKGHFGTATAAQGEAHQTIYGEEAKPAAAPTPKSSPVPDAGPLKMPEFKEGKNSTVIKALYEKVGQKIIDHAHAGNVSVLEGIPEPHKKMWMGKTPNSKKLLALYAEAMAYAKGETNPADDPIAGWKAAIAAGKTPTKAQADAMEALSESDPDAYMEAFMTAVNDSIPDDKNNDNDYDAALEAAHDKAYKLQEAALLGSNDAPAKIDDGPKEGDTKPAADGGTLVLKDGHWVKQQVLSPGGVVDGPLKGMSIGATIEAKTKEQLQQIIDNPASFQKVKEHAQATLAAKHSAPATLGNLSAQHLQNLQSIPWYKLKLPDSNTNAATVNKKLQAIQDAAFAGNVAQLHAMKFGSNTYGKKLALLAQTAIAALGGNATAAVPVEPAPAAAAAPAPAPTQEPAKKPRITADTPLTEGQQQAVDGLGKEALEALAEDGQPLPANVKAAIKKKLAEMNGSAGVDTSVLGAAEKAMLHKLIASNDLNGLETASKYGSPPAYKQAAGEALAKLKASMPKTATAVKTTLHNTTAGHNKSWSVHVAPNASGGFDLVTEYGKIGKSQQKNAKPFPTEAAAHAAKLKLINEKKAKGYVLKDTDYGHKVVVPEPQKPAMPTPPAGVDKSNVWMKWVTGSIEAGATDSLDGYINALKNSDDPDAPAILKYAQQGMEYLTGEKAPDDGPKEGDTKQGADGLLVLKNGHWVKMGEGDPSAVEWDYDPSDMAMSGAATLTAEGDNGATFYIAYDGDTFQVGKMDPGGDVSDDYQDFAFLSDALIYMKDNLGGSVPPLASLQKLDKNFKASDLPGAKSAAAPSAAPASSGALEPMDSWTQTGGQGGSNPGGKFKDASGQEWYVKWPDDAEAVKSEVLAAKLYALAGLSSQDAKLVTKGGKIAIASKWVNIKKAGSGADLAKVPGALEGFAVDAWLGNWDVVGLSLDNLQIGPDGKAHRVDAGGSLEYRAQGEKKPFGAKVEEIDTLRDAKKNPKAASVFGKMTEADITASVAKVAALDDEDIREVVNDYGPGDAAAKKAMADTLIARRQDLLARFPAAAKGKKKPLNKAALPVAGVHFPKPHDFQNWNGLGKGLSSKTHVNKSNEADEYQMLALAQTGNLTALESFRFQELNKETGSPTGKLLPVSQHPSKHVQQFHQDLIQILDEVSNPPEPLKVFRSKDIGSLEALNAAFPPKKFGTTVSKVASNEKLGFWVALGAVGDPAKFKPKNVTHYSAVAIAKAKQKYASASSLAKHFIKSVQASGTYNDLFRNGKTHDSAGNSLKDVAKAALAHATEMPEGTSLFRWQAMSDAMLNHIMSAKDGTVFQATGPMCTSYDPHATKGFGKHRVTIRYAKGAKAVESFASGGFASEKEVTTLPNARFVILSKQMVPDVEHGNPSSKRLELEILMLPPDLGIL